MYSEQALEQFRQTVVTPWHHASLLSMDREYRAKREQWAADFIEHFQQFCRKILDRQQAKDKEAIGYITYSLLRTGLTDGHPAYLAEAFDERWFFDRQPVQEEYDPQWAFQSLEGLESRWEPDARKYAGKIPRPLLERLRLEEAIHFHSYVSELIRYAMPQAVLLPEYQALARTSVFEVRVGEYMDHSITVYKEDRRGLSSRVIREWLDAKMEGEYAYQAIEEVDLSGIINPGLDFRYTAFRACNLSTAKLSFSMMVGTHWRGCLLEETDLSFSALQGADFRGCRLPQAICTGISAGWPTEEQTEWIMPGLAGVCFAETDLHRADFRHADLRGADFTAANLRDADFTGADLRGANFAGANLTDAVLEAANLAGASLPEGPWNVLLREAGR